MEAITKEALPARLTGIAAVWWPVLSTIPLFASIDGEEFQCLDHAQEVRLRDGEVVVSEGDPPGPFFVVVEGSLYGTRLNNRDVFFMRFQTGSYFGHELILLESPYLATARSEGDSVVLRLEQDKFWQMLRDCPSINRSLLRTTAERARTLEAIAQHDARMAALNKLAAGLAHELNNPASALVRTGHSIASASATQIQSMATFLAADLPDKAALQFGKLLSELAPITPAHASDQRLEEQWFDELSDLGAAEVVVLPGALVAHDKTAADLEWLRELSPAVRRSAVELLEATLCLSRQGEHVRQSSRKISQVVAGLKSYAVLDQEPVQIFDVNASLNQAITAFESMLHAGATLVRLFGENLRPITGPALELNMVWTALLENARAALPTQGGVITVRSYADGPKVAVEIQDNGCGIPDALQPRLFEPFFTTREVGRGIGLGLFMARRIIVERFRGDIWIESRPGSTTVHILL
jgi:signal transduction histidine kinase